METVNWIDKSPGYYIVRSRIGPSGERQYLTPQGGFSRRRTQATMFETAQAAELAAKIRTNNYTVLANRA